MKFKISLIAFAAILLAATFGYAEVVRVPVDGMALHSEPRADSSVVTTLSQGTLIGLVDKSSAWYKVRVLRTRQEGFVQGSLIHSDAPTAAAAPPPPRPPQQTAASTRTNEPSPVRLSPAPSSGGSQPQPSGGSFSPPSSATRGWDVTAWGGFTDVAGSQLTLGGNLGLYPFDNPAMELDADLSYTPGNIDVTAFLGSFTYNIHLDSAPVIPYVSAGFGYARASTDVFGVPYSGAGSDFQGGGGLKFPMSSGRFLRVDLRFIGMTRILAGLSF